jgi:hypothetical protein
MKRPDDCIREMDQTLRSILVELRYQRLVMRRVECRIRSLALMSCVICGLLVVVLVGMC